MTEGSGLSRTGCGGIADAFQRRACARKVREDLRRMVGKGPNQTTKDFADQQLGKPNSIFTHRKREHSPHGNHAQISDIRYLDIRYRNCPDRNCRWS